MRRASSFLGLILPALVGCSDPDPTVVYEPYDGDAYPDRVAPIAWPEGGAGIVTDSLSDTLSLVDLSTGKLFDQRPVGRNPVDIDGPHHVAVSLERGEAFIALSYPVFGDTGLHSGHGGSRRLGWVQRLSLSDLSLIGEARVEPNPGDIALSADGRRVVVSHFDLERAVAAEGDIELARASLAVFDADRLKLPASGTARFIPTCVAPHGMSLTKPDGARAFVACYGEDRLALVDLEGGGEVELFDVGPGANFGAPSYGPYVAALSPDQSYVVVSNLVSKDVRFFDVATKSFDFDRTLQVQGVPMFPTFVAGGTELLLPVQTPDGIVRYDLATGEQLASRAFTGDECRFPHSVEMHGEQAFVVCEGDKASPGKVVRLEADLSISADAEVGVFPDAIAIVPGPR